MNFFKIFILLVSLLSITAFSVGCVNPKRIYTEAEMNEVLRQRLTSKEMDDVHYPFSTTPEMQQFAKKVTAGSKSHIRKALDLVEAMLSTWQLEYDHSADMTAVEAFSLRKANCLAFTNLFIGLSRSVGMRTVYVDVPQIEEVYRSNNIIINSGHICAGLYDGAQFYLIDFSRDPEKGYRVFREIDDFEALANYYNNLGYQATKNGNGDLLQAIQYYRLAAKIKPGFSRAYNNLGVTYSLLRQFEYAKKYYEMALKVDPEMPEANWNLGRYYFATAEFEKALDLLKTAVKHTPRNSEYHYRLGMTYLRLNNLDKAEKELKAAIKYNRSHIASYLSLADIYASQGDIHNSKRICEEGLLKNPDAAELRYKLSAMESYRE